MRKKIVSTALLEPLSKSTRSSHIATGLSIPRATRDPSVLVGFVAGVILTAAAFVAVSPFIVRH